MVDIQQLPFSLARICSGSPMFLAGQIGLKDDGKLVEGLEAQTIQALENIDGLLSQAPLTFDKVVKITAWLVDLTDEKYATFNAAYIRGLREIGCGRYPARSAVGVASLPLGALVELEAVVDMGYQWRDSSDDELPPQEPGAGAF